MRTHAMWAVWCGAMIVAGGCSDGDEGTPGGQSAASLVSVEPADGATGVAVSAPLKLVFDRAVDEALVSAANVVITPDRLGTWSWDAASKTATFRPRGGWVAKTAYRVKVDAALAAGGREVGFETADAVVVGEVTGDSYTSGAQKAEVKVSGGDGLRTYTITTNAKLRDDVPADKRVVVTEQEGQARLRSGSALFDGLFTLAQEELRQDSVSAISDGAFNNGQGVACECFETGEKWRYVWTRDTAYAAHLGLAMVDAPRTMRSLDFKLSTPKGGGGLQIVQDTGSGGSYPVSTDRVVWALGAWEVLQHLDGAERERFRDRAYEAMVNTIDQDRRAVWDAADGLYRGEQSFLDWREQSYPSWTAQDTVHLAMSKTLSTNVGHLAIMEIAALLAEEKGESARAAQLKADAGALREALRSGMWLEEAGMFSAMKPTGFDQAALHKFDLLGESLAVLWGVPSSDEDAARVVAEYPRTVMGPPVLWPQQPLTPIYHNRGIWPFVTAYGLLAARSVGNAAVVEQDLESLVRGAALNLSNMENFEFLTQQAWVEDGQYSGPVVNSRRQLWSVAGYLGAVMKGVFGLEASPAGLRVSPFVTPAMHKKWFASGGSALLEGWSWRGKKLDVTLKLPASVPQMGGAYRVAAVRLNGAAVADGVIKASELGATNAVEVELVAEVGDAGSARIVVDEGDYRAFWAPREPSLTGLASEGGKIAVSFEGTGEDGAVLNMYRDGVEVARGVTGGKWVDEASGDAAGVTHCYAVEAEFSGSGNRSHHSRPQCWWGGEGDASRVRELPIWGWWAQGGAWSMVHGQAHYEDWGRPEHTLETAWRPAWTGKHRIQAVYGNGAGGFNTGIAAGVKRLEVREAGTGALVGEGVLVMPQLGDWERWGESSFVEVELDAGKSYSLRLVDAMNMTYFAHFEPFTGGPGGGADVYNMVNVHALRVLPMAGQAAGQAPALRPDGADDLGKFAADQQAEPGAKLADWSRVALAWDERSLWLALASPTFEDGFKPWMIYLRAGQDSGGSGLGMEYSGQRAALPFAPTHAVVVRRTSEGAEGGPWSGVWVPQSEGRWAQRARLEPGVSVWMAGDNHTVVVRVPRALLGDASALRMVAHVVNAQPDNEWKEVAPAGHMPWMGGGESYKLDLSKPSSGGAWEVVPAP
jgi:hypothetical protein